MSSLRSPSRVHVAALLAIAAGGAACGSRAAPVALAVTGAAAANVPASAGKFVLFAREPVARSAGQLLQDGLAALGVVDAAPTEWTTALWSCAPARPERGVERRLAFARSPCDARPLLDFAHDDSEGLHPRFVVLHDARETPGGGVQLLDVDFATWTTRTLWRGRSLRPFGVLGDAVHCEGDDTWLTLDARDGALHEQRAFAPLWVDGEHWLVRRAGDDDGRWSYHGGRQQFVARFGALDEPRSGATAADDALAEHDAALHIDRFAHAALAPDGRTLAWVIEQPTRERNGGVLAATLIVQRAGATDVRVPVAIHARAGSGERVIDARMSLTFARAGCVELRASKGEPHTEDALWTVDLATGAVATSSATAAAPATAPALPDLDGVPVPDYLQPFAAQCWTFGRAGLAPAFLLQQRVVHEAPEYGDGRAGVSRDGRHVVWVANRGELAGTIVYGDLVTRRSERWPAPTSLDPSHVTDIVWVDAPR